jgi:hypothetical protein
MPTLKTSLLFSLLFTIAHTNLYASEQTLATISNDDSSNTYQLIVDSTEDDRAIKTFYKDVFQNGKKISRDTLDYHVLDSNGMILEQRKQYIVMKLKSDNFDKEQGGVITVDTLYNGASGDRKSYEISMAKDENGWVLMNQGKVVKDIAIQTNKVLFLGTVGIKNLIMK